MAVDVNEKWKDVVTTNKTQRQRYSFPPPYIETLSLFFGSSFASSRSSWTCLVRFAAPLQLLIWFEVCDLPKIAWHRCYLPRIGGIDWEERTFFILTLFFTPSETTLLCYSETHFTINLAGLLFYICLCLFYANCIMVYCSGFIGNCSIQCCSLALFV